MRADALRLEMLERERRRRLDFVQTWLDRALDALHDPAKHHEIDYAAMCLYGAETELGRWDVDFYQEMMDLQAAETDDAQHVPDWI